MWSLRYQPKDQGVYNDLPCLVTYSSFCLLSNKNLVKSLISFSASILPLSKWTKALRGKVEAKCLDHVSRLCSFFLFFWILSPSNLHCLNSSSMPLSRCITAFPSSSCSFQGSGDEPKLLNPLLSGAKPKTTTLIQCTYFLLLTVFSILGNVLNSSRLKYRNHPWFITSSYISYPIHEYMLSILLPECLLKFSDFIATTKSKPSFSLFYFIEITFILVSLLPFWSYHYSFFTEKQELSSSKWPP